MNLFRTLPLGGRRSRRLVLPAFQREAAQCSGHAAWRAVARGEAAAPPGQPEQSRQRQQSVHEEAEARVSSFQSRRSISARRPARRAGSPPGVAGVQGAGSQGGGSLQRTVIGRGGGEAAVEMCVRLGEIVPDEAQMRGLGRDVPPPADAEVEADVQPACGGLHSTRR
ncbi:hypothetical protein THAOC_03992 [Thalassiosira oceanica]|uniref:Uncharacterized protein n=1 Tax=Thalassiosira oceanica TaxID=159749 RepID=K0T9Y8_THAOC|nr:hypothetical protein THAOC_03992 [Thalassiosira oceanica]|eukprot:EJK74335.1 hypothetical protein THAOC_03992 [Thalassiosira oceanica]